MPAAPATHPNPKMGVRRMFRGRCMRFAKCASSDGLAIPVTETVSSAPMRSRSMPRAAAPGRWPARPVVRRFPATAGSHRPSALGPGSWRAALPCGASPRQRADESVRAMPGFPACPAIARRVLEKFPVWVKRYGGSARATPAIFIGLFLDGRSQQEKRTRNAPRNELCTLEKPPASISAAACAAKAGQLCSPRCTRTSAAKLSGCLANAAMKYFCSRG